MEKWAMEISKIDVEIKENRVLFYWWNFEKEQMEQSETDVKTLDILDVDTMGNSNYSIEWNGTDSFNMEKYDCELLFNSDTIGSRDGKSEEFWNSGMGEFKRIEKPENIPISEFESAQESSSQSVKKVKIKELCFHKYHLQVHIGNQIVLHYMLDITEISNTR